MHARFGALWNFLIVMIPWNVSKLYDTLFANCTKVPIRLLTWPQVLAIYDQLVAIGHPVMR